MDLKALANRILNCMQEKGVTEEELAEQAKITGKRMKRILAGEVAPRLQELYDICMTLKVSASYLLKLD